MIVFPLELQLKVEMGFIFKWFETGSISFYFHVERILEGHGKLLQG